MEPITMLHVFEDTLMVSPINEFRKRKPTDSGNCIRTQQNEAKPDRIPKATDSTSQIEALKVLLEEVPEVNAAKVLYFKAQIHSGTYEVDCNKIANKMA